MQTVWVVSEQGEGPEAVFGLEKTAIDYAAGRKHRYFNRVVKFEIVMLIVDSTDMNYPHTQVV